MSIVANMFRTTGPEARVRRTWMKLNTRAGLRAPVAILAAVVLLGDPSRAAAQVLGSAQSFAVLGGSTVTNTGATTLKGNLGVYPGSAITGTGLITITGSVHQNDAVALNAQADALTAWGILSTALSTSDLSGQDLGLVGVLAPGVYTFSSAAQLTGALVLDFGADPGGMFIFQIGTALTTSSGSSVAVLGGNSFSRIYWEVGSSATLGTGTAFMGNIIADQSITMNTGATIACGRAIALNGAVTMDNNTISNDCGTGSPSDFGSSGFSGGGGIPPQGSPARIVPTPEPSTLTLFGSACVMLVGVVQRRRSSRTRSA